MKELRYQDKNICFCNLFFFMVYKIVHTILQYII